MTEISTLLLSLGTTLGVPAAYFSVLRYPDAFSEKVGAMAIFHESHFAEGKDANQILSAISSAVDVVAAAYNFCNGSPTVVGQTKEQIADLLATEAAKLQGYKNSNELTDNFQTVAEEKLQLIIDGIASGWQLDVSNANSIKLAIYALQSAMEMSKRKMAIRNTLYRAEMKTRQASIESLKWTLNVAMSGLKSYFAVVAGWFGYCLHSYGEPWKVSIPMAFVCFALSILMLNMIADRSIKPASELLATLMKLNAEK